MKKISVIGTGKTGSKVCELLQDHAEMRLLHSFNSKNNASIEKLNESDGAIVFVDAEILTKIFPILLRFNKPIVCGTTGFNYHAYTPDLRLRSAPFIHGSNFSMGVHLVRKMLETLRVGLPLLPHAKLKIHEIHHTQKKDAPSGTAKSMNQWIGNAATITSERIGDVVGFHELSIISEFEKIKISHEALNRDVFAEGALKTLETLFHHPEIKTFLSIEELLDITLFQRS